MDTWMDSKLRLLRADGQTTSRWVISGSLSTKEIPACEIIQLQCQHKDKAMKQTEAVKCSTGNAKAMEWNGMEWNEMEWNGMQGKERNAMEWNGMQQIRCPSAGRPQRKVNNYKCWKTPGVFLFALMCFAKTWKRALHSLAHLENHSLRHLGNALTYAPKKSADPGLRQGRGGAWDHRRCGPCPLPNPPNLYP